MSNVRRAYERNRQLVESKEFVSWMCAEIRRSEAQVIRIHVSGDFFDAKYTNKWLPIVRRNRRVKFLAYTRSWRVPEILAVFRKMARSLTCSSGFPATEKREFHPAVAAFDQDVPRFQVDLVFRNQRGTVMKYDPHGNLVCGYDQGVRRKLPFACSRCKICWTEKKFGPSSRSLAITSRSEVW